MISTAFLISFRIFFVLLSALFIISLLNICKAPTFQFWLLQIATSEGSIVFAGITILFLVFSFLTGFYTFIQTLIGLAALALYVYPILGAFILGQKLPNELKRAFKANGNTTFANTTPFDITKLIKRMKKLPSRSFTYVTYDDISLKLDYYNSTITGKRPCVVVIHGGSWVSGDSKQLPELNSYLVAKGYNVAAINYRLAPVWRYPSPIEDTTAALKYLREHANELSIDTDNFVLLGRSAGGQIATLAAYKLQGLGIKGAINFYGPMDMIWGYQVHTNPWVLDGKKTLARYLNGHLKDIPDTYKDSSPIEFVNDQTVPTLSIHGSTDSLVFEEHAQRLAKKLDSLRIPNYFLRLPWATHGLDYHLYGPNGQLSTYAIEYFLHTVTQS